MTRSRYERNRGSMVYFLLIYFLIYGGLNFYCFWKLHQAIRRGWPADAAVGAFLLLMTLGPILVRLLERAEWGRTAYVLGLISYIWMPVAMWLGCLELLIDLWNLSLRGLGHGWPGLLAWRLGARPAMAGIAVIIALGLLWSLIEAQRVRLERITLKTTDLPPGSKPLRILQISDMHLGLIERARRVRQVLRLAREARPDLIVSTGDLVDGSAWHMNGLAQMLRQLHAPLGKYAVLGNHEYYVGLEPSLAIHEQAGFRVLRGEAVWINDGLRLVGVDDPARRWVGLDGAAREDELLPPTMANGVLTLLLKHRPTVRPESAGRFFLQLSGHTHAGQVFPFGWLVRTQYPWLEGLHDVDQGSKLYISRGTGTWGAPMRLGAPPQVTLITVESIR